MDYIIKNKETARSPSKIKEEKKKQKSKIFSSSSI